MNVYEIVTQTIIEKLEQGVIPWRKPWRNASAVNWKTQKPYRGINALLLDSGEYATFKQIQEAGGKVKKGAKSQIVVFWKWLEKENGEGETEKIPLLRYYRVFEINTQVEGLESKRKDTIFEHEPIEEAERIVNDFTNQPQVKYKSGSAFYVPTLDYISVPPLKDYKQKEEFYSTMYHEMVHSTGHTSRLNRKGITDKAAAFGSETYSKEELVAEIGSAMLCNVAHIDHVVIDNSTAYIQSWLRKLKNDKRLIIEASGQAQKAVDYILNETEATY